MIYWKLGLIAVLCLLFVMIVAYHPSYAILNQDHIRSHLKQPISPTISSTSPTISPTASPKQPQGQQPSSVDLCEDINDGVWVHESTVMAHVAPCCGVNPLPDNSGKGGKVMHWAEHPKHCGDTPMPTESVDATGVKRGYTGQSNRLTHVGGQGCFCRPVAPMKWVTDTCEFVEWDAAHFCARLGAATVLFIGDSTMMQTASVIMNAIYWQLRERGCQTQLRYASSDSLVYEGVHKPARGRNWTDWVNQFDPDIVVLSVGPHINTKMFGTDGFERILYRVLNETRTLQASSKHRRFIWKTQPGQGCSVEAEKITDWANYGWKRQNNYSYFAQDHRDAFAKTLLGKDMAFMDVGPMRFRPDAHVGVNTIYAEFTNDCTHMCIPGPLSTLAPRALLQVLERWHQQPSLET